MGKLSWNKDVYLLSRRFVLDVRALNTAVRRMSLVALKKGRGSVSTCSC